MNPISFMPRFGAVVPGGPHYVRDALIRNSQRAGEPVLSVMTHNPGGTAKLFVVNGGPDTAILRGYSEVINEVDKVSANRIGTVHLCDWLSRQTGETLEPYTMDQLMITGGLPGNLTVLTDFNPSNTKPQT